MTDKTTTVHCSMCCLTVVVNWEKVFLSFNHEEVKASSGTVKMLPAKQHSNAMKEEGKKEEKYIPPNSLKICSLTSPLQGLGNSLLCTHNQCNDR